ncbi:MAG: epoxyqueuosine reductase QueH [Armatimonadetes bacterium]|nr:epoxyqueuosine reductase QueH [Armatimonadota bacterium]
MADRKPSLLLHVCCGPCATSVLERLVPRFRVTALWYNPNIQPREEHDRRLDSARIVAREMTVPMIEMLGGADEWLDRVRGLESEPEGGLRCDVCFRCRLETVAGVAARLGFDRFATTLTVSPHKPASRVHPIAEELAQAFGVPFLAEDFKKQGGFQRTVELSRDLGLYRQTYCGCVLGRDGGR